MSYESEGRRNWLDLGPQSGEFSFSPVRPMLVSVAGVQLLAYQHDQHTGYDISGDTVEGTFIVARDQNPIVDVKPSHEFDIALALDRIKSVFGFGISRLAEILGVSRTSVYNWRKGEEPSEKYLNTLKDLSDTAEMFERAEVKITGLLLKRKFLGGKSLIDLVNEGMPIYSTAITLLKQIELESEQRDKLAKRFSGRMIPDSVDFGNELE